MEVKERTIWETQDIQLAMLRVSMGARCKPHKASKSELKSEVLLSFPFSELLASMACSCWMDTLGYDCMAWAGGSETALYRNALFRLKSFFKRAS